LARLSALIPLTKLTKERVERHGEMARESGGKSGVEIFCQQLEMSEKCE